MADRSNSGPKNHPGAIVMCMRCRRTRGGAGKEDQWAMVPEFIWKRPRNMSDGICADCLQQHYPRPRFNVH